MVTPKDTIANSLGGLPTRVSVPGGDLDNQLIWIARNKNQLRDICLSSGAVLLEGLVPLSELGALKVSSKVLDRLMSYTGGDSPRTRLAEGLYTSTDFPPDFDISLHNELSHSSNPPAMVLFICVRPPDKGGETMIADSRKILSRLDSTMVEELDRRGICYIRNMRGSKGVGRSWQQTFETADGADVERYCMLSGAGLQWNADGSARIVQYGRATAEHPITKERVWFNQADMYDPSAQGSEVAEALSELYGDNMERMPYNVTFGDGGVIPKQVFNVVREAMHAERVLVKWKVGDALLIDNLLVAHGRTAYKGNRRILVSMSESYIQEASSGSAL